MARYVDFVVSGGIPTRSQGAKLVGNFIGISLAFRFVKIDLEIRLGPHGLWGFLMGLHTHIEPTCEMTCEETL
jgi:hypothetical protein